MRRLRFTASMIVAALVASGAHAQVAWAPAVATATAATAVAPAAKQPSSRASVPPGYLTGKPPVDVLKLLPSPPAPGSAQDTADRAIYAMSAAGIDGPAWNAAKRQLNPTNAEYMGQLSCALGARLSAETTPMTLALIARTGVDFITPMDDAKKFYKRPRPFATDKGRACDPSSNDGVGERLGYAYPSGHAGIGWLWALVLSDAAPAHASAVRDFGLATGDLRIACRVHWLSDVAYGRVLATAVYDRLAAEPEFKADVARAAAELAKAPPLVCPG